MKNKGELQYLDLLDYVLDNGVDKQDRTGVGTRSVFGAQIRFDLQDGFPLLTTKHVSLKTVSAELISFIRGDNTLRFLLERKCNIWNEWCFKKWVESDEYDGQCTPDFALRAEKDAEFKAIYQAEMQAFKERILTDDEFSLKYGDLGRIYGKQWREWVGEDGEPIDQLSDIIEILKADPNSRRMVMIAWQPSVAKYGTAALPACHALFQVYVADGKLSGLCYCRSNDLFLGAPFNLASYALLLHLIANECGLQVGELVHTVGDAHIYSNHFKQVKEQLTRKPRKLPTLHINPEKSIWDVDVEDITVEGYDPHEKIKAPVAV